MSVRPYQWRNEALSTQLRYQSMQAETRREKQLARENDPTVCIDCGDDLDTEDPTLCSRCKAEAAADWAESMREEER